MFQPAFTCPRSEGNKNCLHRTQGLFESIPEALFRSDISSTELRNKGEGLLAK